MLIVGGGLVRPSRHGSKEMALAGIPFQANLLIPGLSNLVAVGIVSRVAGAKTLGNWSWSTVLATPVIGLLYNVRDVGFPALSRLHEHHPDRHDEATVLVARLLALACGIAIGVLAGFTVPIINVVFDPVWLPATNAVRIAVIGVLPLALSSILATAVESSGQPAARLRCLGTASLISLIACIPLVREMGATGGALAVYLLIPTIDLILLERHARVPLVRALFNGLVVASASYAVCRVLATHVHNVAQLFGLSLVGAAGAALLAAIADPRAVPTVIGMLHGRRGEPEAA
jgi:O-antigen/teichoic acid export membrane protein